MKIFSALMLLLAFSSSACAQELFHPDKSGDDALQALIGQEAYKFQLLSFNDEDFPGLEIKYNLYTPESYEPGKNYPVVFFIADGSSVGKEPNFSLTQGYGALVWNKYDCIVIVPTYTETVLDDHDGFITSDYVELTAKFVNYALETYSIDKSRVYCTGQSMGCMTFLYLAAKYPGLFTACLFVSGQWEVDALRGLAGQKFVYAASNGDEKASTGQREVIKMFDSLGVPYVSYQNIDAKNPGITVPATQPVNFVTFKAGTTLPDESDTGKYSEHMTSFDFVYTMKTLQEWLLAQTL